MFTISCFCICIIIILSVAKLAIATCHAMQIFNYGWVGGLDVCVCLCQIVIIFIRFKNVLLTSAMRHNAAKMS